MIRVKRDVSLSYSLLYSFIALGERLIYIFKEPFVGDGGCNVQLLSHESTSPAIL